MTRQYMVGPSTTISAGTFRSLVSPLQSSTAGMAICEIAPHSGRSFSRTVDNAFPRAPASQCRVPLVGILNRRRRGRVTKTGDSEWVLIVISIA